MAFLPCLVHPDTVLNIPDILDVAFCVQCHVTTSSPLFSQRVASDNMAGGSFASCGAIARTILAPEDPRIAKRHHCRQLSLTFNVMQVPDLIRHLQISRAAMQWNHRIYVVSTHTQTYWHSGTATRSCIPVATIQYSRSISWLFRDSHHASTLRRASIRTMPPPSLLGIDMPGFFYLRQVRANNMELYCATSGGTRV